MFEKKENTAPNFTTRMLVTDVKVGKEVQEKITLNEFAHFTLNCTANDESETMKISIHSLAEKLKSEISFKVSELVNFGDENAPLWAVKLDLGSLEKHFRQMFSNLFDSTMCKERNGTLYLWDATNSGSEKCPHVTIGRDPKDLMLAKKLVELDCELVFGRIDYKKVGPNKPEISVCLSEDTGNQFKPY